MKKPEQVILIDAKNFAHRYHWTHLGLRSEDGYPTSVMYGCLNGMVSLSKRFPNTPIVWVWDGNGKTWRHKLTEGVYKANRTAEPKKPLSEKDKKAREEFFWQLPKLKEFLKETGFRAFEVPCLEGDDMMGILVTAILQKDLFKKVIILSGDRDFYQFIGPRVKVLKGIMEGKPKWANRDDIEKEFGIPMSKWLTYRAITGDSGDNIPHAFKGCGPKTAAEWVNAKAFDPSKKKFNGAKELTYRGKTFDIFGSWDKIHTNYLLCQIVRDADHEFLSSKVKEELDKILGSLKTKSFLRRQSKVTEDGWRYMTKYMRRYDMAELMSRRKDLWRLL